MRRTCISRRILQHQFGDYANPKWAGFCKISDGSVDLSAGTDYTVSGNIYTIKAEYLNAQEVGALTLTFEMSGGANPTTVISIYNPPPVLYWQNTNDGRRLACIMDELDPLTMDDSVNLDPSPISTAWRIAAVADMNGSGQTDIIFEHSTNGRRIAWYMDEDNHHYLVNPLILTIQTF